MFREYKCKRCNHVQLVQKKFGKDWKKVVKCNFCGKRTSYKQFSTFVLSVGYNDGITYNASPYTPLKMIPEVGGVTAGVEVEYE